MNNTTPSENLPFDTQTLPSPLQCLIGALIAGGFAIALYSLTASIAHSFATKPIHSHNLAVVNIAAAVRTLVVGAATLGTGIFSLVAVGLVALAVQILVQKLPKKG